MIHPTHERARHVFLLVERLRLKWLLAHWPPTFVWEGYVCLNSFVTIAVLALLAVVTRSPFVFPSLGPTAYLFFFTPLAEAASPRNTILGHAIGLACGFLALSMIQTHAWPPLLPGEVDWARVLAAATSFSLTGAMMVLLHVNHPPAGATTLIVSLGILSHPASLFIIEGAVVLLTAQALLINRLAGLPYPLWSSSESHQP